MKHRIVYDVFDKLALAHSVIVALLGEGSEELVIDIMNMSLSEKSVREIVGPPLAKPDDLAGIRERIDRWHRLSKNAEAQAAEVARREAMD